MLSLGRAGEHLACTIVFDVSDWKAEFGPGTTDLLVQRCGEETAYPAELRPGPTGQMLWDVTRTDTAKAGNGRVQLVYLVDGRIVKSAMYRTWVSESLESGPEPPPGGEDWLDKILAAGSEATQAANRSESAAQESEKSRIAAGQSEEEALQYKGEASESAARAGLSEKAAAESERLAKESANNAAQSAAQSGYMSFEIDSAGHLIYKRTPNVNVGFKLEEGRLIMYA